jgi:dCTP deaminase
VIVPDFMLEEIVKSWVPQPPPSQINPASVDIRLGDELKLYSNAAKDFTTFNFSKLDGPFLLRQGDFLLAHSLEAIVVPREYAAILYLKSSRAREGGEHAHAGFVDPGFGRGQPAQLTLELTSNIDTYELHYGMLVGQIVYVQMLAPPRVSYDQKPTAHYNGQQGATVSWTAEAVNGV